MRLQNVFEGVRAGDLGLARYGHFPGLRSKPLRVLRRVGLVRTEFVVIVVGGDVLVGVRRLGDGERGVVRVGQSGGTRLREGFAPPSQGLGGGQTYAARKQSAPGHVLVV